jgi:hypothetical protein
MSAINSEARCALQYFLYIDSDLRLEASNYAHAAGYLRFSAQATLLAHRDISLRGQVGAVRPTSRKKQVNKLK